VEHAQLNTDDVVEIEIEGFVTSVDSATNFVINDVPVQINATTTVEGGSADEIVEIPQGQACIMALTSRIMQLCRPDPIVTIIVRVAIDPLNRYRVSLELFP